MKLFAIITASLMATAGGAYYLHSNSSCCAKRSNADCPVAQVGGCCAPDSAGKPVCCTNPCPACEADCLACCDACEVCCSAGVQASVSTKAADKSSCCAGTPKVAAKKAGCCGPNSPCCEAGLLCCLTDACCEDAARAVAKVAAKADCCFPGSDCCFSACCTSPAKVATTAALAGVGAK